MNRTIKFFLKIPYQSITRQGIIPRGVKFWRIFYWLAGVSYPDESAKNPPKHDSPGYQSSSLGYHTAWSQSRQGIIPQGVKEPNVSSNLPGVAYLGESISPGLHTPASQSYWGMIPRRVNLLEVCNPGELLMTPGSQQPFLNTFAQAFKGTVAQK